MPLKRVRGVVRDVDEHERPDLNYIDSIVREVRYDGRAVTAEGDYSVRREVLATLRRHQVHTVHGPFDRVYTYIAEHY